MHEFWRWVSFVSFALCACAWGDTARSQTQQINFDDLGGSGVRSVAAGRYRANGLLLGTSGAGLFVFGPSTFANTAPDWLYGSQTAVGGNADANITMRFISPTDNTFAVTDDVSFSIADGDHLGPWTVQGFDISGTQVALVTGMNAPRVRLTGKPFHRVVFTPSGDFDGIDSLTFNDVVAPSELAFSTPVAFGGSWRFLHPTTNVDPATTDADFNTTWFKDDGSYNGPAFSVPRPSPLGYGVIDLKALATDIGTPASGSRYSAYFTTTFEVDNAALVRTLSIDLLADDGAFIYLNGQLVARHNVSATAADAYRTLALGTEINGVNTEVSTFTILLDPAALRSGTNFLAVSLHNQGNTSSDLGLDLQISMSMLAVPEPTGIGLAVTAAFSAAALVLAGRRRGPRLSLGGGQRAIHLNKNVLTSEAVSGRDTA
ncbi:MAG: hypothetical protein WD875_15110 [Pirellulales bacterium]